MNAATTRAARLLHTMLSGGEATIKAIIESADRSDLENVAGLAVHMLNSELAKYPGGLDAMSGAIAVFEQLASDG